MRGLFAKKIRGVPSRSEDCLEAAVRGNTHKRVDEKLVDLKRVGQLWEEQSLNTFSVKRNLAYLERGSGGGVPWH